MMKRGKRLTALLLALVMILGLAACGGAGNKDNTQQLTGTVYVPEFMDVDLETNWISSGCCDGENVYLLGSQYVEETETDPETGDIITTGGYEVYKIYKISLETKEVSELENYKHSEERDTSDPRVEINIGASDLTLGADGTLWITERVYKYVFDLPEDFDPETQNKWEYDFESENSEIRRQLDTTGNEISRLDTASLPEKLGAEYLESLLMDSEGNLYAMTTAYDEEKETSTTKVAMADKDMNVLFTLEMESWGDLRLMGDGAVGVICWTEDGRVLRMIDKEAKDWGKEYMLPANASNLYAGSGDYLFYYNNGDSLYGCKAEALEAAAQAGDGEEAKPLEGEKLFSWSNADINQDNLEFFTFMPDGRVAAMTRDWKRDGMEMELAILTATDASVLADKTILTYACVYCDYEVRADIIDFNRSNTNCRIEIKDYSEFNTDDDYTAGITKLNTEIMAGQIPDLIQASNLPITRYGAKGLLEDLWPFIDGDSELGRDKLMTRPLEAAEQNGKLYQIFKNFSIHTVVGASSVVGDKLSWTLQEMQDALATMPEGCTYFGDGDTKSGMLQTVLSQSLERYVDWETGKCNFDSPDFIAALEFCNSFPLEFNWEDVDWETQPSEAAKIKSGQQMLDTAYLGNLEYMQYYKEVFGGDFTFVGYPVESGVGSSFNISGGIAMSSKCKDKDAAWSFVRNVLLADDEDSYYWNFPVNKEMFDKQMAEAMEVRYQTDENGNQILDENGNPIEESKGGWWIDGVDLEIKATTQAEYDQFMELYNAIDSVYTYDTEIYDIVNEMAAPYFNGDATVDEIVKQIQSRVGLYVNEQK